VVSSIWKGGIADDQRLYQWQSSWMSYNSERAKVCYHNRPPGHHLTCPKGSAMTFKHNTSLTYDRLREVLIYYPNSGEFIRKITTGRHDRWKAGTIAAHKPKDDYPSVSIDGISYLAHRLAWFYMTGKWPKEEIDHRDLDRANNRWSNLREATHAENCRNVLKRKNNKSGFKGVNWCKQVKKWVAKIRVNNKRIFLGAFSNKEEAAAAYECASKKYYGEFSRTS